MAMFGQATVSPAAHPFIGKYAICRCYRLAFTPVRLFPSMATQVILRNSRRLWSWKANNGVALSVWRNTGWRAGKLIR